MNILQAILLSVFSFGLLALSFPPLPLGLGAPFFLAPWFCVLLRAKKSHALIATYIGGIVFYFSSIYWLYHVGNVAPKTLIFTGIFLGVSFLSLYNLLAAWVFIESRRFRFRKVSAIVLFPLFWAGVEVVRAKGDLSFPWLSLGLVFGDNIKMLQGVALFGVFGYSIIIIASNICLAYAVLKRNIKLATVPFLVVALIYAGGSVSLGITGEKFAEDSEHLNVAIVQPSIHQTDKWTKSYYDSVVAQTWGVLNKLNPQEIDVIVFPETAIPDYLVHSSSAVTERKFLRRFTKEHNTAIVIGALSKAYPDEKAREEDEYNVYNSAFLFSNNNSSILEFRKMHLVPFSEHIPFKGVIPMLNYVDLGDGNFSPGDSISVWEQGYAPLICYEAIYGDILRSAKRKGAKFIVNITNDGWFQRSTAPWQHFNLVRAHAVENGISIARAANTGISAFINPYGFTEKQTEIFAEVAIESQVPLKTRTTPYFLFGDVVEWVLFFFSLAEILFLVLTNTIKTFKSNP